MKRKYANFFSSYKLKQKKKFVRFTKIRIDFVYEYSGKLLAESGFFSFCR